MDPAAFFSVQIGDEDRIGIVVHIGPVVNRLAGRKNQVYIFERDKTGMNTNIFPESSQAELLPECQLVFITSSSLINRTLESILPFCSNARDVVMVGSSTPLYPEAFTGTGVSVLSGTRWLPPHGNDILSGVSQCAGIRQLMRYGQKISVRVRR